ncbi:MAG: acetylornithine deacetylase [Gammaproteobacteria bacterium]|nr:acetylornithine deacetylase [Gammaproteobacteria bacterium]
MNPPSLLEMISTLIAIPSVSSTNPRYDSGNRQVIDQLAEWLAELGFQIEIIEIPEHPLKANLIATLGSGPGGLVLSGHTDTVPFNEELWHSDPFKVVEREQKLYGLGSADMKSFFALVIDAIRELKAFDLKEPLIILATADEESSMAGARELARLGRPKARHAVIGEPTSLRPINAHKGMMMEAIHLLGRSGHSSNPDYGISALEGMHNVITTIKAWRDELQSEYRDERFALPIPTLNLGHIHGGDNPNRICGHCELHIDLRPLPGMDITELQNSLRRRVEGSIKDSGLELNIDHLFGGIPAMETPATAEIIQAAERFTGHTAESVAFGTEGPFLQQLGMETVILGPGDIAQAHQPDEYLGLDQLNPTTALIRNLVNQFCC